MAEQPSIRPTGDLVASIREDLADNNAGLISARDVRVNMMDLAYSIPYIVASGDWDSVGTQFISNIYLKKNNDSTDGGIVVVESGIQFQNDVGGGALQVHPYPGPGSVDHGELLPSSLVDDDHPQYLLRSAGSRTGANNSMQTNLGMGQNWVNASGSDNATGHGLQFEQKSATEEVVHVGEDSYLEFDKDATEIHTGRSTAQAWINFNSISGVAGLEDDTLTVHASYNISRIERLRDSLGNLAEGRYKIYFKSGLFDSANEYLAVGHATGRTVPAGGGDFTRVNVGIALRHKDYLTYFVQQENGDYTDSYYNDLVVFGVPSGVDGTTGESVTVAWETTPAP